MTRRALLLLARLERSELDRERQALLDRTAELARHEEGLRSLEAGFGPELALALDLPGGPALAAAYAAGCRHQAAALRAGRHRLRTEIKGMESALRTRAVGLRTLELAAAELSAQEEVLAARAEQGRLDEAAIVRHRVPGRQRPG